MAPPKRPWFRFYTEALTDPKLRRLNPAQRWLWVAVLGAARQSPTPGLLLLTEQEPLTDADLADLAGLSEKQTAEGLAAMDRLGLIGRDEGSGCWRVTKWNDRQFESDDTTKRTAKHRTKERSINVDVADQRQRQKTDTETPPSSHPPLSSVPAPPPVDDDEWIKQAIDAFTRRKIRLAQDNGEVIHTMDGFRGWARDEFNRNHLAKALENRRLYPDLPGHEAGKVAAGELSILNGYRRVA